MDGPERQRVIDKPAAAAVPPTRQMARFVAGLHPDHVDGFARRAACRHLVDTVGAMVAGASQGSTASVEAALAAALVPAGAVPVPGLARRYDALHAAYVGGAASHALELDDGYRPGSVHPGAVVVPAALALGHVNDCSGAQLLLAVVAGYEAVCRVAAAVHPRSRWRGFHNTGTAGVFGAAAAASVLLRLDAEEVENAFGLAGSEAAGLFSFGAGGDVKRVHPGHAARGGLMAALLTQGGLAGPLGVLEYREGFINAFAGGPGDDASALDLLRAGDNHPRSSFAVANCYMKPHACCRHIHAAIDAVLDIAAAGQVAAADIAAVRVGTYAIAASHAAVGWSEMTTAQMSYPFVIATALTRGRVGLADFGDAERKDPAVLGLIPRIHVTIDPALEAVYPRQRGAQVTVETQDGRRFERSVPEPFGAASDPLDDAAVARKFMGLSAPVLGEARAQAALDMLWQVEALPSLRPLLEALSLPPQ